MKVYIRFLAVLFVAMVLFFGAEYAGLLNYQFFGAKVENVRRKVFEETQSYVEAKRQAITKYYDEWRDAEPEDQSAIRSIVLQDFANFDLNKLSPTQRMWYNKIIK